jgi:hypothetical protein
VVSGLIDSADHKKTDFTESENVFEKALTRGSEVKIELFHEKKHDRA